MRPSRILYSLYCLLLGKSAKSLLSLIFVLLQGQLLIPDYMIPLWIFFVNYLPTLVITFVNNVIPEVFDIFAKWEDWKPRTELKLKLYRLVVLRISALCKRNEQ